MGCGESKHAVAIADTITPSKSKRSNSRKETTIETTVDNAVNPPVEQSQENGNSSGETKDSNIVQETENVSDGPEDNDNVEETITAEEKEENDDHVANGSSPNEIEENVVNESSPEVENEKEIEESVVENEESKGENLEVKENVVPVHDEESHHFFSPRKDGETIESIISDGLSGKSEYHSPRARKIDSEELAKGNDVVSEKGTPEETKNDEAVNVNEVKEAEVVSPVEGNDSASTEEEKASTAKEVMQEIVAEASTEESKTN